VLPHQGAPAAVGLAPQLRASLGRISGGAPGTAAGGEGGGVLPLYPYGGVAGGGLGPDGAQASLEKQQRDRRRSASWDASARRRRALQARLAARLGGARRWVRALASPLPEHYFRSDVAACCCCC
jgi:hypothetical protein